MARALMMLLLCSAMYAAPPGGERALPWIVSTEWLEDHLNDEDLVVLQVGFSRKEFLHSHLPSARFLWFNWLAPSTPDLSTEMPPLEDAERVLESLGVRQSSKIVLVATGQNLTITTRMFLALSYFGFGDQAALLDGGFERWKTEGRAVSREDPDLRQTSLTLRAHPDILADADWVRERTSSPGVAIVDARTKQFYDGNGGGVARQGHIKGALHLPYASMTDSSGRLKSAVDLQRILDGAGIRRGDTVVTYCHVGQQATLVYYVARYLGYPARVYDGCFEEWNVKDERYPVEKTMPEKP